MDFRQLNALVAVAEHGSFSAAADALGTVQSNVSTHVRKLEDELGQELIDRSTGRLTEAGQVVAYRAHRISAEIDALSADVGALAREVSGTVRVGMIGTTARWLIPEVLGVLPLRHPHLHLVLIEATTTGLEAQLAGGQADLAVLNLPAVGSEVSTTPLFEEELALAVPVGHPLGSRPSVTLADLVDIPLLLPLAGTAFRRELDDSARARGISLRARFEVDSTRLIASLTFEGCGPAILPVTAVPRHLRDSWQLVTIDGLSPRVVGVALRRRGLPSAPARAVLDVLTEIVGTEALRPAGVTSLLSPAEPMGDLQTPLS
jgi:DNA-binding transcriptional LysR family regulator